MTIFQAVNKKKIAVKDSIDTVPAVYMYFLFVGILKLQKKKY